MVPEELETLAISFRIQATHWSQSCGRNEVFPFSALKAETPAVPEEIPYHVKVTHSNFNALLNTN